VEEEAEEEAEEEECRDPDPWFPHLQWSDKQQPTQK
jgi:hypothetical protein